ncbi:NUDIX hydrolase [Mucilaginibacter paludis]|nr:NUDIX domain-containing protein [Mucilaginibacter paludis]
MAKQSAGILLFRLISNSLEVLLVHPGGPFFKNKDLGSWSIPKGEFLDDEDALLAARREFKEETGFDITGDFLKLKPVKLKSGKNIHTWAVKGDIDAGAIVSNTFEIQWPPSSGRIQAFPEIDRAAWFTVDGARDKINPAQFPLIEELQVMLSKHTTRKL